MVRTKMEARRGPRPACINEETRREQEEEETEVLQPLNMYFSPSHYRGTTKIATCCFIYKAVEKINTLDADERRWFHEHPQFRHFFHMPLEKHHRMQAMSMLTLRAACTEKKKECWFVVNGVPVRYSLREQALMTGMYCHPYPGSLDTLGSMEFVNQHFGGVKRVTYAKVEKKLLSMGRCVERLQMAVLYFLSSVIIGQKRKGVGAPSVEPFFLRAVNDLELCTSFPWGRLAFDANMRDIFHMLEHFKGVPIPHWSFPSFITSLELLPYEAILCMKRACRDEVIGANRECPRMCKMRFKPISMKGWPISELNEVLGTSKDIESILEPTVYEELLLARIMNGLDEEDDAIDPIVDGWKQRLMVEQRRICFEELYNKDVAGRAGEYVEEGSENENEDAEHENMAAEDDAPASEVSGQLGMVEKRLTEAMEKGFKLINERVDDLVHDLDRRLKDVENFAKERRGNGVGEQEHREAGDGPGFEGSEIGDGDGVELGGEAGDGDGVELGGEAGDGDGVELGGEAGDKGQEDLGEENGQAGDGPGFGEGNEIGDGDGVELGGVAGDKGQEGLGEEHRQAGDGPGFGEGSEFCDGDGGHLGGEEMEVPAEEKEGEGLGLEAEDMEVEASEKEGDGNGLEAEEMEVEAEEEKEEEEEKRRYVNGMLVVDDEPLLVSGMRCSEVKMVNGKRYKFLNKTEYYPSCMAGVPLLYARNSKRRRGGRGKPGGGHIKGKPLWN